MKKGILVILSLLLIGGLIIQSNGLGLFDKKTAYAVGDLNVVWESDPLFNEFNIAPGFTVTKNVNVANGAPSLRPVAVKGILTSDPGDIKSVMDIEIKQGSNTLYSGTLADFFTQSAGPEGINLSILNPGTNKDYSFKVTFKPEAGNAFQNKNIVFDLQIGVGFTLPAACENIVFNGETIFGTSKSDNISGTSKNDLIISFEGSDKVDGKGGNDCIVGGDGSDKLIGGTGNDVILGGNGSDSLEGNNGADELYGEGGSDSLKGGDGADKLYGGAQSDSLQGENGNDILDGGDGSDSAKGGSGTDTCIAESSKQCEL